MRESDSDAHEARIWDDDYSYAVGNITTPNPHFQQKSPAMVRLLQCE